MKTRAPKAIFLLLMVGIFFSGCIMCPSRCTVLEKEQARALKEARKHRKEVRKKADKEFRAAAKKNDRLEKIFEQIIEESSE